MNLLPLELTRSVRPGPQKIWKNDRYPLLQPGIAIADSRGIPGTLGCFVRVKGKKETMMLSSYHVLYGQWGNSPGIIHHVQLTPGGLPLFTALGETKDGKLGIVTYRDDRYYIDCAVTDLFSPWQTGNTLWSTPVTIKGIAPARPGTRVKKVGQVTGYTEGIIIDIHYPDEAYVAGRVIPAPNQILIKPLPGSGKNSANPTFARPGDSGSVILNEKNKIVGLLWGSNSSGEGVACPIGPVLEALNLEIAREKTSFFSSLMGNGLKKRN